MIQVMDIELKSAAPDFRNILVRNFIALLGYDLKRSMDAVGLIQVHQLGGEIAACDRFDVMGHDHATRRTLRPEPNERHLLDTTGLHQQTQKLLVETVDREVYGPSRER